MWTVCGRVSCDDGDDDVAAGIYMEQRCEVEIRTSGVVLHHTGKHVALNVKTNYTGSAAPSKISLYVSVKSSSRCCVCV